MNAQILIILSFVLKTIVLAQVIVGADQFEKYKIRIQNKKIGLVVNQTSTIGDNHLVDHFIFKGIKIEAIFAPEHGFRGESDAGEDVKNQIDTKTGLPIKSLYGKNKKPSKKQLNNIELMVFDIQDVGTRFYTYISTMHYVMEACAENKIPLLILDRPNPNGFYVAGPVLDTTFRSFVGMHPIPIVHGCTIGELAVMINEEGWLRNGIHCDLEIIDCIDYTHKDRYSLPIPPSPNLPNDQSVALYPSLCLFEGTSLSVGRGTPYPFQVIGAPPYEHHYNYEFTPRSNEGAKKPKFQDVACFGRNLTKTPIPKFTLKYLVEFYKNYEDQNMFFKHINFFNKLAGNNLLIEQIKSNIPIEEIKESWNPKLQEYLTLRKKYLRYPDFTE